MKRPADYEHLIHHAQDLFPAAVVDVIHTPEEIIYIDVEGHRYTFEISSDDDEYIFCNGRSWFSIPLFLDPTWD